ncbi:MAG TPA: hypothetical protein EYQ43_10610 [Methyloprofundus sp.]|uniref:hypothetical protein n=1 Tax=Methyloprofundus sp. TaxID=2020875 RepID=UPI0018238381|nr:hypothetical protein [Methyloprofundus sp.]HIG65976.1 hypothetical protein [Methyloprofundus sp.]HIL79489.1 hypothetical protein [Methylococcales bacterium]
MLNNTANEIGPEGRAYMLLGLDGNSSSTLLESTIKTSMQQDQALWQKFKGSKSFADLAANIASNERLEQ